MNTELLDVSFSAKLFTKIIAALNHLESSIVTIVRSKSITYKRKCSIGSDL